MTFLSRRISFSAGHRYFQKKFSEAENKKVFGSSYSQAGHGHNYVLELTISGTVDANTGMVINLVEVDQILKQVVAPMDHHFLNLDIEAFKDIVPTTENVAKYCFDEVKKRMPSNVKVERTRLFETDTLWADYYG